MTRCGGNGIMRTVICAAPGDSSGLRERKKARTREAIIDAALQLFESQGFEAITVEDIAAAADVSPRTFFRYFETKLDVVMARNVDDGDDLEALVAARPASEGPIEAVHQVIREKLAGKTVEADDSTLREMRVVMSTPSLRAICVERFHDHIDGLAGIFATRLGAGPHDLRPHILAGAVSATLLTIMDRWVADGARPERLVAVLDEAFGALEAGLDTSSPSASTVTGAPAAAAPPTAAVAAPAQS
jgi:AcrR family transcriptional regulator